MFVKKWSIAFLRTKNSAMKWYICMYQFISLYAYEETACTFLYEETLYVYFLYTDVHSMTISSYTYHFFT